MLKLEYIVYAIVVFICKKIFVQIIAMTNLKLIKLFKTFSSNEFIEFGKFVCSPFHNESSKLIQLYKTLKKFYPSFDDANLSKEYLFKMIYGNVKYDDKKMRDRLSDMLSLAEDYLSYIGMKSYPPSQKRFALRQYMARDLDVHFEKKYKEIETFLKGSPVKDSNYFEQAYLQIRDWNEFFENKNLVGKREAIFDGLEEEANSYLIAFCVEMLTFYTVMNNWGGVLKYDFTYKLYDEVMSLIEKNNFFDVPLIKAFYLIMKMQEDRENDSHYFELKKIYSESSHTFKERDKLFINTTFINEAMMRSKMGKAAFQKEIFEILKTQLESETYTHENEWMSREQYFNYVSFPLDLEEDKWVEWFIENYTDRLEPTKRENALHYANSLLHFHRKNYEQALKELIFIKGGDYLYYLNIKFLECRIYFDLYDFEKLLFTLDSFRHFLTGNSAAPESVKFKFNNYVKVLSRLTSIALKHDEYKLNKLIADINTFTHEEIAGKNWLLKGALELNAK